MRVHAIGWHRSLVAAMVLAGPCLLLLAGQSGALDKGENQAGGLEGQKKVYVIPEGSWAQVLDWLKDQTGLPLITPPFPTGTFRYPAVYEPPTTLLEVLDLLNEALVLQYCTIIRREASMIVWPADEPLPLELSVLVKAKDLADRGRSEFVHVEVRLEKMSGDDAAKFAKSFFGLWGQVVPAKKAKHFYLAGTAGNVRRAYQLLVDLDAENIRSRVPHDSWKNTLDWLSQRTGLALAGKVMPVLPLAGPWPDGDRLVRTGEMIDLINVALAEQGLLLIRGQRGISVVWRDEPPDAALVPLIRLADLDERGKTEVVSIHVALKRISTPDAVASAKTLLTRFGRVQQVGESELVLQDTAGNLQAILSKLRQMVAIKYTGS